MPRVSIIIPTFNCARFLGRAIDSALSQTYTDYEIIVVDDGSTDGTGDVIGRYVGKIQYVYQSNKGVSAARNMALSKASGELIAYLDADDMWYPNKLEKQVAFLDTHRECGIVHTDVTIIDEMDEVICLRLNEERQREVPQGYCMMDLLRRCHIQTLSVVERRECIERTGTADERLPITQDYLHWILVAMDGIPFGYIGEPLAMYRRRLGSLSSNERSMIEGLIAVFATLLQEKSLALRCGHEAADIAKNRLYGLRRNLAYLDRLEGRTAAARKGILGLIPEWPWRGELYIELLKACVSPTLATMYRQRRDGRV